MATIKYLYSSIRLTVKAVWTASSQQQHNVEVCKRVWRFNKFSADEHEFWDQLAAFWLFSLSLTSKCDLWLHVFFLMFFLYFIIYRLDATRQWWRQKWRKKISPFDLNIKSLCVRTNGIYKLFPFAGILEENIFKYWNRLCVQ